MDQLEESNQTPQEFRTPPNFRVIMNINQLVEMATIADTVGKKAREAREQAAAPKPRQNLKIQHPLSSSTLLRVVPAKVATAAIAVVTRRADQARRRERGGKIFRETLAEGDDRIEIDSRLTETGARLRIRLEEGFVKIFGRLLANGLPPQEQTEQESN